jgi:primosomal protein N' (replication factor Y)
MPDDHASSTDPTARGAADQERPESETAAACRIRVLLPLPLPEALDYLAPQGTSPPEPGSFVRVPLGQRSLVGIVWDGAGDELPAERLKPVLEVLPIPRLQPELRGFVVRVGAYTMAPPGSVLRMTMSVAGRCSHCGRGGFVPPPRRARGAGRADPGSA